jgi:hypothetical protein
VTAHDDAMPDDLNDAEAFNFDPPLSWDPGDGHWAPTPSMPFDDGSAPLLTDHDIDRAAVDLELYRRAAARCFTSEPHRDADEDLPCSRCLLSAAKQLAIASHLSAVASTPAAAVTAGRGAGVDGAPGGLTPPARSAPGAPSPNTTARVSDARAVEGGLARPQNGR